MDKAKLFNLAYWGMIAVVILTCIFLYFYLTGNAKECLANPLEYYADKLNTTCYCWDSYAMP